MNNGVALSHRADAHRECRTKIILVGFTGRDCYPVTRSEMASPTALKRDTNGRSVPKEPEKVSCWNEQCGSTEVEHRWLADPIKMQNLDEWKCNECGLRWARWSEPCEGEPAPPVTPW